jgi:hypothetical protein
MNSFSKIVEKVVYNRLLEHLNNNNIISERIIWIQEKSKNKKSNLWIN